MKTKSLLLAFLVVFTSCSNDKTTTAEPKDDSVVGTISTVSKSQKTHEIVLTDVNDTCFTKAILEKNEAKAEGHKNIEKIRRYGRILWVSGGVKEFGPNKKINKKQRETFNSKAEATDFLQDRIAQDNCQATVKVNPYKTTECRGKILDVETTKLQNGNQQIKTKMFKCVKLQKCQVTKADYDRYKLAREDNTNADLPSYCI
ncbi:MAG: hypothetical protein HOE90_07140 [Bacteriovoracaceae bacterium]|jgi:hypothetical protein|nr:hypothetical protein [Bacteriovoracaceae bacterium]